MTRTGIRRLPAELFSTLGREQSQFDRSCFAGSALGCGTTTCVTDFGCGTASCFIFTGARFGIASLNGNGEAHEQNREDEFLHALSYSLFRQFFNKNV